MVKIFGLVFVAAVTALFAFVCMTANRAVAPADVVATSTSLGVAAARTATPFASPSPTATTPSPTALAATPIRAPTASSTAASPPSSTSGQPPIVLPAGPGVVPGPDFPAANPTPRPASTPPAGAPSGSSSGELSAEVEVFAAAVRTLAAMQEPVTDASIVTVSPQVAALLAAGRARVSGGMLQVYIDVAGDPVVASAGLTAAGVRVDLMDAPRRLIHASVPFVSIDRVRALPFVVRLRLPEHGTG